MLSYFTYRNTIRFLRKGIFIKGTIIRFHADHNNGQKSRYYPIIEYQNAEFVRKQFQSKISYREGYYVKQQLVDIILSPSNDKDVRLVNYLDLYWKTLLLLTAASLGLIIGGGHYLYTI